MVRWLFSGRSGEQVGVGEGKPCDGLRNMPVSFCLSVSRSLMWVDIGRVATISRAVPWRGGQLILLCIFR